MPARRWIVLGAVAVLAGFLAWRSFRPMNIFVVSPAFERPVDSGAAPAVLGKLRAENCGACHPQQYRDWQTTVHSRAWTEPYFQADWAFDGRQQICRNCHTPLDRQQEHRVLGFRDRAKWDPVLAPNPDFDAELQKEGVTCAGCHFRDGKIMGPGKSANAPHPTEKFSDPNEVCLRCHVVQGNRWDTFYKMPPCGTVAEIAATEGRMSKRSGEYTVRDVAGLGCVQCHMPEGRHLWRGGHDPAMVRSALSASLSQSSADGARSAQLVLENSGAAHFLPTGTPDRHLSISLRALDARGQVLAETDDTLQRTVMWRPFIVDLWDSRLQRGAPRRYSLELPAQTRTVEAQVRYHLLGEARRERIGYQPEAPLSYPIFDQRLAVEARPTAAAR
ncbi:MAG: multiheme c-type cytochrome [Burkholderiales bacterium]